MDRSDMQKFAQAMAALGEIYSKEVSKVLVSVYYNALESYPIDEVLKAIQAHTRDTENGQFWPKPADLIRHLEGSNESRAMEAWSKVIKAIGSVGMYRSIAFDDPVIHKVIDEMGGWISVCNTMEDELPFRAAEFQKRYRAAVRFGYDSFPRVLVGYSDQNNMAQGYQQEPEPALFGDQHKALMTLQSGEGGRSSSRGIASAPISKLLSDFSKGLTSSSQLSKTGELEEVTVKALE